jgi:hypothetical protein
MIMGSELEMENVIVSSLEDRVRSEVIQTFYQARGVYFFPQIDVRRGDKLAPCEHVIKARGNPQTLL